MNVYFMAHGNLVKIGKSSDPEGRLKTLQTGAFMRVRLLAVAKIDSEAQSYEIERQLHEQFAWSRRRGEFFSLSRPLKELIAGVSAGMDVREAMSLTSKSCRKMAANAKALRARKAVTPPVAENARKRRTRLRAEARGSGGG